MEYKNLTGFVLLMVFVGMLMAVGIIVLDNVGIAAKESTTVTGESVTILNRAGTTANDDVTSVTRINNTNVTCTSIGAIATNCAEFKTTGALTLNSSTFNGTWGNGTYDVSYVYDADTDSTTATSNTVSAVSAIASTWLPLIITIVILSIILVLVMNAFSRRT